MAEASRWSGHWRSWRFANTRNSLRNLDAAAVDQKRREPVGPQRHQALEDPVEVVEACVLRQFVQRPKDDVFGRHRSEGLRHTSIIAPAPISNCSLPTRSSRIEGRSFKPGG